MFNSTKLIMVAFLTSSLLSLPALADRDRGFNRGRGGARGNERSERPRNFAPGRMTYGGNGCPEGTMQIAFAPDNLSFSILFDKFIVDTAANASKSLSCDAIVPIEIPAGQQMEITRVDYRGFVDLPGRSQAQLESTFNFVEQDQRGGRGGARGWKDRERLNIRYNFMGPLTENYEISTGAMVDGSGRPQTEVSPCGGQSQLRIRNSIRVNSARQEQASITIDSIDADARAVYFVSWRSCGNPQPRPQPEPRPQPQPQPTRRWVAVGTACGPQQPWGTSLMCPNTSPNGGPIGMSCDNVAPGTKCYGAAFWNGNYACTNPYNGQTNFGTLIFNMYECQ